MNRKYLWKATYCIEAIRRPPDAREHTPDIVKLNRASYVATDGDSLREVMQKVINDFSATTNQTDRAGNCFVGWSGYDLIEATYLGWVIL